jgi:LDH2 family malate/lactate/ureidoglycolate dehydrogenase
MTVVHVDADLLAAWAAGVLVNAGMSPPAAETTAAAMLHANRRGLDSHGVVLLGVYVPRLRHGHIRGDAEPELVHARGATALLDGHYGPGAHTARAAMDWACAAAETHGIGAAIVRNSCHFGAASFFSEQAAEAGCVGVAITNTDPGMAPVGGLRPILGTNPLAIAAPAGDGAIVPSLDIATSVVAQGRVAAAARAGVPIPEGWAIGLDGAPTTNPEKALRNSMLPMAAHKGFGLAFMIDLLSACLAGTRISAEMVEEAGVGHVMVALDASVGAGMEEYRERLRALIDAVHSAPRRPDVEPFMIPGEREHVVASQRGRFIPIDLPTRELLDSVGSQCGLPFVFDEVSA